MKRKIVATALARTGLLTALGLAHRWSGVAALNYHRIGDGRYGAFDRDVWSATAEDFDRQVTCIASHFDLVTPADLPDVLRAGKGRCVILTFDDGYLDNYEIAFPILKRHGVRATFFIVTGFLDNPSPAWWDEIAWMVRTSRRARIEAWRWLPAPIVFDEPDRQRAVGALLQAYKAMPADDTRAFLDQIAEATGSGRFQASCERGCWMTWDMIREMKAAGMVIGGHTATHPVLSRLPASRQCEEIAVCGRRLAEELGEPMSCFSYPVGERSAFTDDTRACLRSAGVRYAFSYYGGIRTFDDWDDLDIRRIAVESCMNTHWVCAALMLPGVFGREG